MLLEHVFAIAIVAIFLHTTNLLVIRSDDASSWLALNTRSNNEHSKLLSAGEERHNKEEAGHLGEDIALVLRSKYLFSCNGILRKVFVRDLGL